MNYQKVCEFVIRSLINQSFIDRESRWTELPPEQEKLLEEMLDAAQTLCKDSKKMAPEYKAQVNEALLLMAASELGMPT